MNTPNTSFYSVVGVGGGQPLGHPQGTVKVERSTAVSCAEQGKQLQLQAAQDYLSRTPSMSNRVIVVHGGGAPSTFKVNAHGQLESCPADKTESEFTQGRSIKRLQLN